MANDVVFKTKAFGGFNKDEVMDFVNKILAEKSELEKRVAESNAKCAQANAELQQYKYLEEELVKVKNQLNDTNAQIAQKDEELNELRALTDSQKAEIEELSQKAENAQLSEEAQVQIDSLQAEVNRLKAECEKKRDIERQVGAAMLDARVHSEELVEAAKERANSVTKSVYAAIGDTALKIDDLSAGIGEIARSFAKSVEEVELRIKALTGDMSKTAQLLISESGVITESRDEPVEKIEYDFLTDPDNGVV